MTAASLAQGLVWMRGAAYLSIRPLLAHVTFRAWPELSSHT